MPLTLLINGSPRTFADLSKGTTINLLVGTLGVVEDRVAVELNGDIVARAFWNQAKLTENDRIEIVHFVGGGTGYVIHSEYADTAHKRITHRYL